MAESGSIEESLIPGLPDEVALLCLARLPFGHHPLLSCVCRSWRRALQLPLLFSIRARLGLQEPFVFVVVPVSEICSMELFSPRIVPLCYLIDPCLAKCYPLTLPPHVGTFPCFDNEFYNDIIAAGRQVCVLPNGRDSPRSWDWKPLCFDVVSRLCCTSTHIPPMLESRTGFASASVDGYVYPAGGTGVNFQYLKSAEWHNLASKKWERIPDMTEGWTRSSRVAWKGSFCVYENPNVLGHPSTITSVQVWDPMKEDWQLITGFFPDSIHSVASVKGQLYALKYEHEESKVMWLDEEAKHWIPLESFKGALEEHISEKIFGVGDELWMLARSKNYCRSTFLVTDPESLPLCWRLLPCRFDGIVSSFCVVTL